MISGCAIRPRSGRDTHFGLCLQELQVRAIELLGTPGVDGRCCTIELLAQPLYFERVLGGEVHGRRLFWGSHKTLLVGLELKQHAGLQAHADPCMCPACARRWRWCRT